MIMYECRYQKLKPNKRYITLIYFQQYKKRAKAKPPSLYFFSLAFFFWNNAAWLDEWYEHFVLDGSIWCNRPVPLRLYPRQGQKRSFIRFRIHISVRCQVSATAWSGCEIAEAKRRQASAIITAGESFQKKLCFLCCGAASLGAARRW